MTQRANIYYDTEIDTIVNNRSLNLLPLIENLLNEYPRASLEDVFYTVSCHVQEYGMASHPEVLLRAPLEDREIPVEEVIEEAVEEAFEEQISAVAPPSDDEDFSFNDDDSITPNQAEKARILRTRKPEKARSNLNVREFLKDIDELDL